MDKKYYPNKIRCKLCNTVIESKFTHDFQTCSCGKVFIDGGYEYRRVGCTGDINPEDCFEEVEIEDNSYRLCGTQRCYPEYCVEIKT